MSSALTLYDASSPLLSQSFTGASSFPQSGSWSWAALIDSGVKGAIKVLSRYSAAGVDPYTVIAGQVICSNFKLSLRGSQRLQSAITSLKSMNTLGNMLHFGFGVDSVVRNLAATEEGGVLVALCAAATECFLPDHAANILWELMRTFKAPERQTPSPLQWKALLKACAGTLAETEFPKFAEHLMHLHPENDRLSVGRVERDISCTARGVSSADTIAEALLAIGKVSTGELLAISIVGGGDAGWLAAIAQWIFDLRIAVFDSSGELLHASGAHLESSQVSIYFVKPSEDPSDLRVATKGTVYPLRDITELFFMSDDQFGAALVCSRVPWAQALSLTFGTEFRRLMEMLRSFGRAIASASAVFDYIAKGDSAVHKSDRQYCQTYFQNGRGRGFLAFITSLFPELQSLRGFAEDTAFRSYADACETYDSSRAHIKAGCGCSICKEGIDLGIFEDKFCLVLLMESIIVIAHSMTGVHVSKDLYPMRSGLEAFYRRQLKLHESEKAAERIDRYGFVGTILEFNNAECEEWNIEEAVAVRRVVDAARIFSGRNIQSIDHEQTAISVSGIVVFLNALLDGGLPVDAELCGLCTVVPGHIEMHGRSYAHMEDFSDFRLEGMDYRQRREGGIAPSPLFDPSPLTDNYHNVSLIAAEGVNSVKVGLRFQEENGDRSVVLGPATLTERVLSATGLFHCDGRTCEKPVINARQEFNSSIKLSDTSGQCETWHYSGNGFGRLVALSRVLDIQPMFYEIWQNHECLNCCIAAAELSEFEKAIIISDGKPRRSTGKRLREA